MDLHLDWLRVAGTALVLPALLRVGQREGEEGLGGPAGLPRHRLDHLVLLLQQLQQGWEAGHPTLPSCFQKMAAGTSGLCTMHVRFNTDRMSMYKVAPGLSPTISVYGSENSGLEGL